MSARDGRANVRWRGIVALAYQNVLVSLPRCSSGDELSLPKTPSALKTALRTRGFDATPIPDLAPAELTLSIGVATRRRGEPVADLVARADRRLYAAKAAGRDRVVGTKGGVEPSASVRRNPHCAVGPPRELGRSGRRLVDRHLLPCDAKPTSGSTSA